MAEVQLKRSARIVEKITELWDLVPDWRFGQLVDNVYKAVYGRAHRSDTIFYNNDEKFEEGLDILIKRFNDE